MTARNPVLDFTGKKPVLWFITHKFVVGHRLPYVQLMSTSRPPDVIHVTSVPWPSLFFALFSKLKNKKNGVGLGTRLHVALIAIRQENAYPNIDLE